ncbi:serine--tRNA ligase-like protein [Tanacetum coccineum]
MADNTKCTPKGIVENLLIKIDKFIFPVDFIILDMVEDIRMPIILERPLLATTHAKVDIFRKSISLEVGSEKKNNNDSKREELEWENLSLNDWMRIRYGKVCKMTEERILKDYWRERFTDEEDDLEENLEDPEECGEDKANTILGLLGMTYEEPTPIIIEKAKVTRYTVGPGETYTKVLSTKNGIRGLLDSFSCGRKVLYRRNHKGETRLFYRHFARSQLLQLPLGEESNTQGSLLL